MHKWTSNCPCCGISRRNFLGLFSSSLAATVLASGCQQEAPKSTIGATTQTTAKPTISNDQPVKIGYLPITDASPLLVAHARKLYEAEGLTVEQPRLFRSWAQIVEAFLAKQVNVVHLLMPTTISIRYGRKFPAKVVAWNHTNGSALTVLPEIDTPQDLGGKSVAIPFWYSVHNVVLQQVARKSGLKIVRKPREEAIANDELNLLVLPPSDMVSALANKSISGYIVAEPFNAAAENLKTGKILRFTGDVWKDHACCVVLMHEDDLTQRKEWSQGVVNSLVKAQHWMRSNRPEIAQILSKDGVGKYTPHPLPVLERALSNYDGEFYGKQKAIQHPDWKSNRIDFQPYPFPSYTAELVRALKETQVEGDSSFLQSLQPDDVAKDLVNDEFVRRALPLVGGASAFGLPESLTRTEIISI